MTRDQGFKISETDLGRTLTVTGEWTPAAADALSGGQVDALYLNYALGYRERDLDFLEPWPIKRLKILSRTTENLEPIYRLSGTLQRLDVDTGSRTVVDLTRLPQLEELSAAWRQIAETLSDASLRKVPLRSYSEGDLSALTSQPNLEFIQMKDRPQLRSLDGLHALPVLTSLGVYGARNLNDLTALRATTASITTLELQGCSGVNSLDDLVECRRLTRLNIADCGSIASLRPLRNMHRLEILAAFGSTKIVDGDLSPLLDLKQLSFLALASRRAYSPGVDEVKRQLGTVDHL